MGETTAAIAAARPDVNFLGVEVFLAGVGALLKRIGEQHLDNIRIVHHDAVEVVREMLAAAVAWQAFMSTSPTPGRRSGITSDA